MTEYGFTFCLSCIFVVATVFLNSPIASAQSTQLANSRLLEAEHAHETDRALNHYSSVSKRIDAAAERIKNIMQELEIFRALVKQRQQVLRKNAPISNNPISKPMPPSLSTQTPSAFSMHTNKSHSGAVSNNNEVIAIDDLLNERKLVFSSLKSEWNLTLNWSWKIALLIVGIVWFIQKFVIEKIAYWGVQKIVAQLMPHFQKAASDGVLKTTSFRVESKNDNDIFIQNSFGYIDPNAIEVEEVDAKTYANWEEVWRGASHLR